MVYSALSDSTTRSQFTRRKAITVTTGGTSTPANYQVKLTIAHEPEMQADFDDIRFNTRDGDYIDYWIESYTASTTATVWIKLPDAISDPGSDTILMYYGNPSLSDGSNIEDTFLFGDDFPGSSIDTEKWTVTGTIGVSNSEATLNEDDALDSIATFGFETIVTAKSKADEQDSSFVGYKYDASNRTQIQNSDYVANDDFDNIMLVPIKAGSNPTPIPQNQWSDFRNTYYQYTIKRISSTSIAYSQDSNSNTYTNTAYIATQDMHVGVYVWDSSQASTLTCDWIFVRIYIANEPTQSYGTAQHQRRTPQFIG